VTSATPIRWETSDIKKEEIRTSTVAETRGEERDKVAERKEREKIPSF